MCQQKTLCVFSSWMRSHSGSTCGLTLPLMEAAAAHPVIAAAAARGGAGDAAALTDIRAVQIIFLRFVFAIA